MNYDELAALGLQDDGNLKLILKGSVESKVGVFAVVFITKDVALAKKKLEEFNKSKNKDDYFMVYSCPTDTYLPDLGHYPSLEISKEDLL
ncbi:hypothetical protein [Xylocopilactobacillus apis]|uniref:Uncharacterized protein n=1 Tax=Xylocopilactobacillus apis TaxID=2932183 RepID=A0AAU9DE87_9LACO|nr:hypothetical protein [Xylocopilactobacillus apis]BDR56461.1 hypothetical protein KIMC2_10230 [Xylocopilactobacillus apis]